VAAGRPDDHGYLPDPDSTQTVPENDAVRGESAAGGALDPVELPPGHGRVRLVIQGGHPTVLRTVGSDAAREQDHPTQVAPPQVLHRRSDQQRPPGEPDSHA